MKVEIRETRICTAEIDPMDVVKAFPVEWQDFLGKDLATGGWDQDDVREFVEGMLHDHGADIFLEVQAELQIDGETEVEIR